MTKTRFNKPMGKIDEDAGTARIVRRARAAPAAGDEFLLPKNVVDQLVKYRQLVEKTKRARRKR
jgi:hypothetical protein